MHEQILILSMEFMTKYYIVRITSNISGSEKKAQVIADEMF